MYKGLDILTAKVTKEERKMAPHHMLDIVDPLDPSYTVVQFRNTAAPIVISLFFVFSSFVFRFSLKTPPETRHIIVPVNVRTRP